MQISPAQQLDWATRTDDARGIETLERQMQNVSPEDLKKLKKVSEEFESVFLDLVMRAMRNTVPQDGITGKSSGENLFRGMLDSEYAKILAQQRHTGIAAQIEKDLLKSMQNRAASIEAGQGKRIYEAQGLQTGGKQARIEEAEQTP